jgi:hypothetical protein
MIRRSRTPTFIVVAALALLHGESSAQQRISPGDIPKEYHGLDSLGELRLKTWSIHGISPMVVLFTAAPPGSVDMEEIQRGQVTSSLLWLIDRMGVSIFSLKPRRGVGVTPAEQMQREASRAFDILEHLPPAARPRVYIGFGDGATAAARLLLHDSSSASLIALSPLAPVGGALSQQQPLMQQLLAPTAYLRTVLVIESMCNGAGAWAAQTTHTHRHTVLLLPEYDGWLADRRTAVCPTTPSRTAPLTYELGYLVTDWLQHTVVFPE